ncbi:MAG: hypothetical protein ACI4R8_00435 [Candidatus Caccovivens sp.]
MRKISIARIPSVATWVFDDDETAVFIIIEVHILFSLKFETQFVLL